MDTKLHWEKVYSSKAPDEVSWFRPHLNDSQALIERAANDRASSIIDVGGGESTLTDDLLLRGYKNISVLDVSPTAIEFARKRLGSASQQVRWIAADICQIELEPGGYDLWHDRAVFHFLTDQEQRIAYVQQILRAVKTGGHVIVATFGPEGPRKCSGLDVVRYDPLSLQEEFGPRLRLIESFTEQHRTPFGTTQQFLYCWFKIEKSTSAKV